MSTAENGDDNSREQLKTAEEATGVALLLEMSDTEEMMEQRQREKQPPTAAAVQQAGKMPSPTSAGSSITAGVIIQQRVQPKTDADEGGGGVAATTTASSTTTTEGGATTAIMAQQQHVHQQPAASLSIGKLNPQAKSFTPGAAATTAAASPLFNPPLFVAPTPTVRVHVHTTMHPPSSSLPLSTSGSSAGVFALIQQKLRSIEGDYDNKSDLDMRLYSTFSYVHEHNFLSVSSYSAGISPKVSGVKQFWSRYSVQTFAAAVQVIDDVERELAARRGLSVGAGGVAAALDLAACPDVCTTLCSAASTRSPETKCMVKEYCLNICPLFGPNGRAVREALVSAMHIESPPPLSSSQPYSPMDPTSAAGPPVEVLSLADIKDATAFSMLLLFYYVRLIFLPEPLSVTDAERMVALREHLLQARESHAFIRSALPMMLLSRLYIPEMKTHVANSASIPKLNKVLQAKLQFCEKYSALVHQYLTLPIGAGIEENRRKALTIFPVDDLVVCATMGDIVTAFPQLKDRIVEGIRAEYNYEKLISRVPVQQVTPQIESMGGGAFSSSSPMSRASVVVGYPPQQQQRGGGGVVQPLVKVAAPQQQQPPSARPSARPAAATVAAPTLGVPTPQQQPTASTPIVMATTTSGGDGKGLSQLRPPINPNLVAEIQSSSSWCDATSMLSFVVKTIAEMESVSVATLRKVFQALDSVCDNDRAACEELMDLPPPRRLLELLDIAYRLINAQDPTHHRVVRKAADVVAMREAQQATVAMSAPPLAPPLINLSGPLLPGLGDPASQSSVDIWGSNPFNSSEWDS